VADNTADHALGGSQIIQLPGRPVRRQRAT